MRQTIRRGLIFLLVGILLEGCSGKASQNTGELLKDPVKQEEIMTAIINDHQMMTKMMDHMMQNDHAMQMISDNKGMRMHMMGNTQMMGRMMMQDTSMSGMMMRNMMKMMEADSATCNRMSNMMMGNSHMMNAMMDMMRKKGMKADGGERKTHKH